MALSQSEYDKLLGKKSVTPGQEVGLTQSILAGIGSGLFKIPEGRQKTPI